jgi:hypothetical protein
VQSQQHNQKIKRMEKGLLPAPSEESTGVTPKVMPSSNKGSMGDFIQGVYTYSYRKGGR